MNNIENEVKHIEAIVDQDYEGLDYWNMFKVKGHFLYKVKIYQEGAHFLYLFFFI